MYNKNAIVYELLEWVNRRIIGIGADENTDFEDGALYAYSQLKEELLNKLTEEY